MSGETELGNLLAAMQPRLDAERYVFASVAGPSVIPTGLEPLMQFHEAEGLTLIITEKQARRAGLAGRFPCRKITLTVHSALEAVGFLAQVTAELAEAGISANAVSGAYHDHLFVAEERAEEALGVLKRQAEAARQAGS